MHQPINDGREMGQDQLAKWSLVSDVSQSMQISFASIKAAVSSLIGGEIIWDQAAQHEFMQTVDKTVDDLSSLAAVMTMAMRFESQAISTEREPHSLPEILSQAKDQVQAQVADAVIQLSAPVDMRPVHVDFEYLRLALRLLFEVLIETSAPHHEPISVKLVAEAHEWQIIVAGSFADPANSLIEWLCSPDSKCTPPPANLRSDIRLKGLVSCQLLDLLAVSMAANRRAKGIRYLTLSAPFEVET